MEQRIIKIIADVLQTTEHELRQHLDSEVLWDSLKKIEIILAMEEEFDVLFLQDEILQITNISSIIKLIRQKI